MIAGRTLPDWDCEPSTYKQCNQSIVSLLHICQKATFISRLQSFRLSLFYLLISNRNCCLPYSTEELRVNRPRPRPAPAPAYSRLQSKGSKCAVGLVSDYSAELNLEVFQNIRRCIIDFCASLVPSLGSVLL